MKNLTTTLLFFIFSLSVVTAQTISGTVIKVKDGDSFILLVGDSPIEIRVNGIDCPEYNQPFGDVAKKFTIDNCLDKTITVNQEGKDKYGRTLATVALENGNDLAQELLKKGLAWHYKKYNQDVTLSNIEIRAKTSKTGLWKDSNRIAPWDFRHGTYSASSTSIPVFEQTSTTAESPATYVYICESSSAVAYHAYECRGLQRCTHNVAKVTKEEAIRIGYRACKICY